jgi:acetyl esterase/lipase
MKRFFFLAFLASSFAFSAPPIYKTPFGTIETDVYYSSNPLHKNALDLYLPNTRNFATVVFIHGGSFVAGDRKEYHRIGEAFQREGIACAVVSYRLMSDSLWPAQPRDVARAIDWVAEHIASRGGDPSRLFVVGHSAGGHLAALVCSDPRYLHEYGMDLNEVSGCVAIGSMMSDGGSLDELSSGEQLRIFRTDPYFKIFGSTEQFANALPIKHVNSKMPPFLLLLGDQELYDPPKLESVREFVAECRDKRVQAQYKIIENRSHMGVIEQMVNADDPAFQSVVEFITSPHR